MIFVTSSNGRFDMDSYTLRVCVSDRLYTVITDQDGFNTVIIKRLLPSNHPAQMLYICWPVNTHRP